MSFHNIVILFTVFFLGLISGLLFSYLISVNIAFKQLSDIEYIKAMQQINRAIQNPLFLICFMGLMFLLPICTYLHRNSTTIFYLFIIASIFYIVGVLGITFIKNIPLNNQLDTFSTTNSTSDAITSMRNNFQTAWNKYHLYRTVFSMLSFLCAIIAIVKSTVYTSK